MKTCSICCSEVFGLLKTTGSCTRSHTEEQRACRECWEVYLSSQVEDHCDPRGIQCLFCSNTIDRTTFGRLARKDTVTRYENKIERATKRQCQDRCAESRAHGPQDHNSLRDGRVFACRYCGFATCTSCDRPEHMGESCEMYQRRMAEVHGAAEAATSETFLKCGSCGLIYENGGGCPYRVCPACRFRFCSCGVPWVRGYYMGGEAAHGEHCRYRRQPSKTHGLKRRFEPNRADGPEKRMRREDENAATIVREEEDGVKDLRNERQLQSQG